MKRSKVQIDLVDKTMSLHSKGVEQPKVHLPNPNDVENRASKFWSSNEKIKLVGVAKIKSANRQIV